MGRFWKAQAWHPNSTIFVVGGGPSLKGMDLSGLGGRTVITANNAYQLVPRPDTIFFADTRWWRWHRDQIGETTARIITVASSRDFGDGRVCRMGRDYRYTTPGQEPLSRDPTLLSGADSGYMAINLAYHYGASRIVLLGFDMGFTEGEAHWHEDHPVASPESHYVDRFGPLYPALIAALQQQGVEVLRCTPSRLGFIPELPLSEALALPSRQRGQL